MRQPSSRERLLALILVAAAGVCVLAFLIALPMREDARNLRTQEASLMEKIQRAQQMYQEMPAAQVEVKRLREKTAELFRTRPQQIAPQMVREVSQLNDDLSLNLTSMRPSEPEPAGNALKYPMTFRVEADFPRIVRLLYELEQGPHPLWVEGIEISPAAARGSTNLYALVHIATYSLKPANKGTDEEG